MTVTQGGTEMLSFLYKRTAPLLKLMNAYCQRQGIAQNPSVRFLFDGTRIVGHETPADLEMEDGDVIDVRLGGEGEEEGEEEEESEVEGEEEEEEEEENDDAEEEDEEEDEEDEEEESDWERARAGGVGGEEDSQLVDSEDEDTYIARVSLLANRNVKFVYFAEYQQKRTTRHPRQVLLGFASLPTRGDSDSAGGFVHRQSAKFVCVRQVRQQEGGRRGCARRGEMDGARRGRAGLR